MIVILAVALLNAALAYVPVILVVGYSLRRREHDDLRRRYVEEDAISTEEYVAEMDRRWDDVEHAPLRASG